MAEIVTGAMGTLLPKLANLIKEEYNLQKKVRGEIMFLETELKSMEAALIKVSEAPIDHPPDVQVKLWTREVRELSYDLEDSIDRFMVRVGDGKPHSFKGFIDRSLHLLTRGRIQHSIGIDIKEIRSRIKDVSERRDRKATELVGAEEKSSDLVKRLMEGDKEASKQPVVLSIVGFGGLGKTTLANLVYEKIKGQFVCGAFVYVSHNPDVVKVFKNMLYQLDGDKYRDINQGTWSEEQLIWELRKFLLHKRYFIVIDDIWNTSVWETIQCSLMHNECGSIIIITTRNIDVAKQAGSVYQMEPLSLSDSTKLFCQIIFGSEDKCPPANLAEVAGKILQKCGGVPLAIITMASMLANKTGKEINTHSYWSHVYQSMGYGLDGSTNVKNMRRILSVSYYDLPSHLKTCLLYLSLYPEDYRIRTRGLIWKWIGEGFVHEEQGKSLYEVGKDYIEELVNTSMLEPVGIGHDGKTVSCRIHDMVLDLISFLSNEEHFLTKVGGQQPVSLDLPKKVRRLSLQISQEEEAKQLATMSFSHVRSLTVSTEVFQLTPKLSAFLVLRVLNLKKCNGVNNHHFKDICNMFQLRYLSLNAKFITEIPREIRNLQFLQVLDITNLGHKVKMTTIIHLRQLLRLCSRSGWSIKQLDGFGKLTSLQEVKGTITIESPSMLHDLGCLTNLRTLGINFRDWDESYEEPFIQCLSNLVSLKSMKIKGTMMSSLCSECDKLYPGPQQLCSIDMKSLARTVIMTRVPRWMSSLCSLSSIKITLLALGVQDIHVLGSIPSLRCLSVHVKETRDERLVIDKCYPFRCLTEMQIDYESMAVVFAPGSMQNLKELHLLFGVKERKIRSQAQAIRAAILFANAGRIPATD
ncbi:disease resistance protein RGA5 isoform X4 [Zea mays]|uniref:Disease resistance protein RPM1 n=1 Tax=Zea mays TaxID=4577 RepID=A0A804PT23_MAIZE|nr:disease resistance protein RGA5 isoform X4 [Zea mays]